eukprot:TRINITY_DN57465_c0_g1_i1.p1 TRINITY_DN57465_c0_g1~~TRINITY_DN57465_c0_g1_i1.p1  ORF type:complete len:180 (-),score=20.76 TRINITY_DN57465_c0_g1_i1:791-1330(-)
MEAIIPLDELAELREMEGVRLTAQILSTEADCGILELYDRRPQSPREFFRRMGAIAHSHLGLLHDVAMPVLLPYMPVYGVNAMFVPLLPSYVMVKFGVSAAAAGMATSCMLAAPPLLDISQHLILECVGEAGFGLFSAFCLISTGVISIVADASGMFVFFCSAAFRTALAREPGRRVEF